MATYKYNYNGVDESGSFQNLPNGEYKGIISSYSEVNTKTKEPLVTRNGDPKINLKITITDPSEFKGMMIFPDIILYLDPKSRGSGMTKHFLHCIGEPYEGEININPDNWINKTVFMSIELEDPNQWHSKQKSVVKQYKLQEDINPNVIEETFTQKDAEKVNMAISKIDEKKDFPF